ncbi:SubName: Full=Uncharacterized protein {ECO:0000313/EMBL:CCA71108.1} [Serendipita indica DSM 11827]|uniref:Uncharacterized protein n=1 Tax=Serendipita indica (strain DSM 11827) TaxID=1109443 RepID=G4TIG4_SERID|nr:SubName: Full=Uncharacterized protein {ECO:0000313/EMBL:CCA71108.1} [Serendipita indica DSM 11827]CCA71108.1 hypothetical protein PIIN_05043 [Serendipita indica DSM 11827]
MSINGFIDAGPRLENTWRIAFITSAAVDIALYTLVLVQSARYLCAAREHLYTDGSNAEQGIQLPQLSSSTSERARRSGPAAVLDTSDGKGTKLQRSRRIWDYLVLILVVLATFKAGCSLATIILLRKPVGIPAWPKLMTKLPFYIPPVLTATIGILTESFYLHRLVSLLRVQSSFLGSRWFRGFAIILIECLFLSALGLAIYCTYIALDGWNYFAYYLIAHISTACVGDIFVTVLTLVCIFSTKSNHQSAERRSRLAQFARITALSAAIPAVTALVNVICVAIPSVMILLWHNVPNYALGQLFILSFLWTLEFRQRLSQQSFDKPSRRLTSPLGGDVWRPTKDDAVESEMLNHTSMFARTIPLNDFNLDLDRKSSVSTPVENIDLTGPKPVTGRPMRVAIKRTSND